MLPTTIVVEGELIVTDVSTDGGLVTVMSAVPVFVTPFATTVAVMVVAPAATPVTTPVFAPTVAAPGVDELHVTVPPISEPF